MRKCPVCNAFVEIGKDTCPYCGSSFSNDVKEEVDTTNYDILTRGKFHKTQEELIEENKKNEEIKIPTYKQENITLAEYQKPKKKFYFNKKIIIVLILAVIVGLFYIVPKITYAIQDAKHKEEVQTVVNQQVETIHVEPIEKEALLNLQSFKGAKYIFTNNSSIVFNFQSELISDTICNVFIDKHDWDMASASITETSDALYITCNGSNATIFAKNNYSSRYDYVEENATRKNIQRKSNIEIDGNVFEVFETGIRNHYTRYIYISEPINGSDNYIILDFSAYYNRSTPDFTEVIQYVNFLLK